MAIDIIQANTTEINRALPFLASAYEQVELFAKQLSTSVEDTGVDPVTLGVMPITYIQSGLDPLASPANTTYLQWTIDVLWNAVDSVWSIDKIRKDCTNTTDTTL